jgi:hypothetical protein
MKELGIKPTFEIGDNYLNVSFRYDPMVDAEA